MTTQALLRLAQWFSPAFPVGSFCYSHGLEWAITAGDVTDPTSLESWLRDVLHHGTGRNDAIVLALAWDADDADELAGVADLARAFVAGNERLSETNAQGAAFARAITALSPMCELPDMPYPVTVGAAARHHDVPLRDCARFYLHSFVSNLVTNAVRFIPLGQSDGQRVLAALFNDIDLIVTEAIKAGPDDLGGSAIRSDLAAMQHETMITRIFRT